VRWPFQSCAAVQGCTPFLSGDARTLRLPLTSFHAQVLHDLLAPMQTLPCSTPDSPRHAFYSAPAYCQRSKAWTRVEPWDY